MKRGGCVVERQPGTGWVSARPPAPVGAPLLLSPTPSTSAQARARGRSRPSMGTRGGRRARARRPHTPTQGDGRSDGALDWWDRGAGDGAVGGQAVGRPGLGSVVSLGGTRRPSSNRRLNDPRQSEANDGRLDFGGVCRASIRQSPFARGKHQSLMGGECEWMQIKKMQTAKTRGKTNNQTKTIWKIQNRLPRVISPPVSGFGLS